MPAARALSSAGTIALESLGVMSRPLAPLAIRFSTACTCDSLSPSCLPAKLCRSMPSLPAWAVAPCFILTKNGLVSVLVINPTVIFLPPELDELLELELLLELLSSLDPQAATPMDKAATAQASVPRQSAAEPFTNTRSPPNVGAPQRRDNVVRTVSARRTGCQVLCAGHGRFGATTLTGARPRRPTMRDVGARAGVSIKTVSRVVNGETTVAADLAARVQ